MPLLIALSVALTYALFSFSVFSVTDAWFFRTGKGYKAPLVLTFGYVLWFGLELCIPCNSDGSLATFFDFLQYDPVTWSPRFFTASLVVETIIAVLLSHALAFKYTGLPRFRISLTAVFCYMASIPSGYTFLAALLSPLDVFDNGAILLIALLCLFLSLYVGILVSLDMETMSRMERQMISGIFLSSNVATLVMLGIFVLFPEAPSIALIFMHLIVSKSHMLALTALLRKADLFEDNSS